MALRWQFSVEEGGVVSGSGPYAHYRVSQLDKFEGTWQATFIGEEDDRKLKEGAIQACLLACELDACPPPGPADPPRPEKRNEWA